MALHVALKSIFKKVEEEEEAVRMQVPSSTGSLVIVQLDVSQQLHNMRN